MLSNVGVFSILSIVANLVFIALAWWALQSLNFEKFIRKNRVTQGRLLYILLAIAIGSIVANFFLDYIVWSGQIPYIMNMDESNLK
ncbi:DUF1146 family protein [Caldibacillus thermoamylovorans]|uniref:DUF1146 family protein n=1 Tax=Bacillaceae TaxID=186817 RepID=UPI000D54B797|nr:MULTISPECIES: DUF1146 family protein [Bacillaceae]MCB5935189.1 DUF1146 family protein [Bacillus sp. DFI.2.34]AWI13873.1 hypothetical protein CQJ30_17985 [Caldibacillus thermoamylovorans]MBU5342525.1 DUF1146 family protein [Caldifermentibacillus hisashii]MCB7076241.1 DUF1146 family protein [Caldibacillus thermoamylovorans]MDL0421436.1 DUF1146 family protein [Caldibacillus thermoamylovorans]